MRRAAIAALAVAFAWGGVAHAADDAAILGTRPSYGPPAPSVGPNDAALPSRIWVPDLDAGFDPQGLAFAEGSLLLSGYYGLDAGSLHGLCRVFRLDPASGRETGRFDLPSACGHAGGLAYAGAGRLYVADTHTLFAVRLDAAFAGGAAGIRTLPLAAGVQAALATAQDGIIWLGNYDRAGPGRLLRFDLAMLEALPDGATIEPDQASARLAIPSRAQGAAFTPDGALWVTRSTLTWSSLERLDPATGAVGAAYVLPGGIEGVAIDPAGALWTVSEAGARHFRTQEPFFPLIFRVDAGRLR